MHNLVDKKNTLSLTQNHLNPSRGLPRSPNMPKTPKTPKRVLFLETGSGKPKPPLIVEASREGPPNPSPGPRDPHQEQNPTLENILSEAMIVDEDPPHVEQAEQAPPTEPKHLEKKRKKSPLDKKRRC